MCSKLNDMENTEQMILDHCRQITECVGKQMYEVERGITKEKIVLPLDMKVEDLGLSNPLKKLLLQENVKCVKDIIFTSDRKLYHVRGFGYKKLREYGEFVYRYSLYPFYFKERYEK